MVLKLYYSIAFINFYCVILCKNTKRANANQLKGYTTSKCRIEKLHSNNKQSTTYTIPSY